MLEKEVLGVIEAPQCYDKMAVTEREETAPHFFLKIYLFYACEYTVVVFRQTRRWVGHQIPLQMVVSHHVVVGI